MFWLKIQIQLSTLTAGLKNNLHVDVINCIERTSTLFLLFPVSMLCSLFTATLGPIEVFRHRVSQMPKKYINKQCHFLDFADIPKQEKSGSRRINRDKHLSKDSQIAKRAKLRLRRLWQCLSRNKKNAYEYLIFDVRM